MTKQKQNKLICSKCKAEITQLTNVQSGSIGHYFWLDEKTGEQNYEEDNQGFVGDDNVSEWWCPECSECLFTNEDDARAFLIQGLPEKTKLKLTAEKI